MSGSSSWALHVALVALVLTGACSVYDESLLLPEEEDDDDGGAGPGGQGGAAGQGEGGGGAPTGGGGGQTTCSTAADCDGEDTECRTPTCDGGMCGVDFAAAGTLLQMQTSGDCLSLECDGGGESAQVEDDADTFDDGKACTTDACQGGLPSNDPEPAGTGCSEGGGTKCDGQGSCVECLDGSDCASNVCAADNTCAPAPCTGTHLVISEIRTRGAGGGSDDFVELYNPTNAAVVLDATWKLEARGSGAMAYAVRWTGTGVSIPSHGHYLITGSTYVQMPAADAALSSGITDAASVRLVQSIATVDAVCFQFSAGTLATITMAGFECEGPPASNLPHNDGSAGMSNSDVSLERKPGGALGNCQDTGDSTADFQSTTPALPQNASSPPT